MDPIVILVAVLVMFAVVAWAGGVDSTERFDSQERERRQHWPGFGGDGKYTA